MVAAAVKKIRLGSVYALRRRPVIGHVSGISSHAQYGFWGRGSVAAAGATSHEQTRKRLLAAKKAKRASLRKIIR